MNNESKIRRSAKSLVLGKAKVISYDDLEAARAERMRKNASKQISKETTTGARKRKRGAAETDPELTATKTVRIAGSAEPVTGIQSTGVTNATDETFAPPIQRAPVARML